MSTTAAEVKDAESTLDGRQIHPLAKLFPPMSADEFAAIAADIKENGLIDKIILYGGKILDGTHRLKACMQEGITPKYKEWNGEGGSPFQFVWSKNWSRRSLTASQRAVIALDAEAEFAKEAASRMLHKTHTAQPVAKLPQAPATGKSRDMAGQFAGVSGRYIQDAKRLKEIKPELLNEIRLGHVTLQAAKRQADKTAADRRKTLTHRVRVDCQGHVLQSDWLSKKDAMELYAQLNKHLADAKNISMKVIGDEPKSGSHMYRDAQTWNPFRGCEYDCTYCGPTFKAQAKRQVKCTKCVAYTKHTHPERLGNKRIPTTATVFVCGGGDISFCDPKFMIKIIEAIKARISMSHKKQTFYLQTKKPVYLKQFLKLLPPEVALVTTLETNRDNGYDEVSKAVPPSARYRQFLALDYPRKVVTIEPVMDFDAKVFAGWIAKIKPEYVWLGLNSHPKSVILPEPTGEKFKEFTQILTEIGIPVRGKELRGYTLPGVSPFQG